MNRRFKPRTQLPICWRRLRENQGEQVDDERESEETEEQHELHRAALPCLADHPRHARTVATAAQMRDQSLSKLAGVLVLDATFYRLTRPVQSARRQRIAATFAGGTAGPNAPTKSASRTAAACRC